MTASERSSPECSDCAYNATGVAELRVASVTANALVASALTKSSSWQRRHPSVASDERRSAVIAIDRFISSWGASCRVVATAAIGSRTGGRSRYNHHPTSTPEAAPTETLGAAKLAGAS